MDEDNNMHFSEPRPTGMATASFVMGVLSIILACCCGGFIFGSLGIIFAQLSRVGDTLEKRAKNGLITSVIGMAVTVFLFIIVIVVGIANEISYGPGGVL